MRSLFNKVINTGDARSVIVKKNIIGSIIIKGISIVVSFMVVPITLGYVSSDIYGIWLTLSSIMLWLNFFDVGFTLGLKNKLAEALAHKDFERGKKLVSTTYFMMIAIFVPLCFIFEGIVPFINWASFLNINESFNDDIRLALYVLIACFSLQMILNVLTAVVAAYQKVALSSAFPVIGHLFSLLTIYILTKTAPPSLVGLSISLSVFPVLVLLVASFILYSKSFIKVAPSVKFIQFSYIKDLFSLGAKFFLIQIQGIVLFQTTNILITNITGPEDVTSYNIAYKMLSAVMMFYSIMLNPLWPAFTDAYAKKDFIWMKIVYVKMIKVYIVFALLILVIIVCSPVLYSVWIRDRATVPFVMTVFVGVYLMINTWDYLQVQLINGVGKIKLQSYITMIGLILHIPFSLLLGRNIGAYGVVISMTLINIIYCLVFTIQINKIINQKATGIWVK